MARPRKQTVDYFPHYCKCGRTIFILENRFGNDGYAFWFKLLEILGDDRLFFQFLYLVKQMDQCLIDDFSVIHSSSPFRLFCPF